MYYTFNTPSEHLLTPPPPSPLSSQLAIHIVQEAAKAMATMPLLIAMPVVQVHLLHPPVSHSHCY